MKILDIGNTRIKCYEAKSLEQIDVVFDIPAKKQNLEQYLGNYKKEDIYTICTNKHFEDFIIINKLKKIDISFFEKLTDFKAPYDGYGIDRLINSYSASVLYSKDILVVSMGSAITYDVVKDMKIEYGYITPGIEKRSEILHISIPHLPNTMDSFEAFSIMKKPTSTKEAIAFGIVREIFSTIEAIKNEEKLDAVLTGGGADIFEGVYRIDRFLIPKGVLLAFKSENVL